MVSYVLNVDKAGDLKFGRKKCRLHKKSEVVQVAKDYGIPTPNKKTVSDLCGRLKKKIQEGERVSREEVKKILDRDERGANVRPLAQRENGGGVGAAHTPHRRRPLKCVAPPCLRSFAVLLMLVQARRNWRFNVSLRF